MSELISSIRFTIFRDEVNIGKFKIERSRIYPSDEMGPRKVTYEIVKDNIPTTEDAYDILNGMLVDKNPFD